VQISASRFNHNGGKTKEEVRNKAKAATFWLLPESHLAGEGS